MASQTDESGVDERNQTWQQILSHVDLAGTRAMLSVNCYLLHLNEHEILVGIKSQGMLKMISGMLPQLEKACAKACKAKVKVSLQVVEAAPQEAQTASKPDAIERMSASESGSVSAVDGHQAYAAPTQNFERNEPTTQGSNAEASQTPRSPQQSSTPTTPIDWSTDTTASSSSTAPWQQEDEVTRAARQLADFFGGKVVDMNDNDTGAETPDLAEINSASLQEKAATVLQDMEAELDSDDDVPF